MCTVTYYPINQNGFILTSNRDESPERPMAHDPEKYTIGKREVVFPKDSHAGGTWIATDKLHTLCLLNGADAFHNRKEAYRKSRGLVLLDFFDFNDVDKFVDSENLKDIEPFTLIVVCHHPKKLYQLRWNGVLLQKKKLDEQQPVIWSSYSLYHPDVVNQRQQWFDEFIRANQVDEEALLNFHRFGGTGDETQDLVMSRQGKVMTVSITQIINLEKHIMTHRDLRRMTTEMIVI